ncbi:hypothetical protein CE91St36_18960 [Christensenellaceae bacterium]|nr:hypothetical protein CE91St36_18960 [Christensenellaceae bacterium]BDF61746.1 hypothetical protein CE91St37_18960 [Christensenellaceae bacterium]
MTIPKHICIHTNQAATKPQRGESALLIHTGSPPSTGIAVASSAETKDTGITNMTMAKIIKETDSHPAYAILGTRRIEAKNAIVKNINCKKPIFFMLLNILYSYLKTMV